MSKTIVLPSGETSSEIHVASSVVNRTVRAGLMGSAIAVSLDAAAGCCAVGCCVWPGVGSDAPSVRAARVVRKRDDMAWGRKGPRTAGSSGHRHEYYSMGSGTASTGLLVTSTSAH